MANVMDVTNNLVREELPNVMFEQLPKAAPFFKDIYSTSVGVKRDDSRIGRGFKVEHLYEGGIAGLMKSANPLGPATIAVGGLGKQTHMLGIGANAPTSPFPNALEAPQAGSLKRVLQLHMTTGNFAIPMTWMQADALSASQIKQVANNIKAVGTLRAMVEATSFHKYSATNDAGYKTDVLGSVAAAAEITTTNTIWVTLHEEYGTIHNFRKGQVIDVVAGNGSPGGVLQDGEATDGSDRRNYDASSNYIRVLVTDVDYLGRRIKIVGLDANGDVQAWTDIDGWGSAAVAEYDYLVLREISTYSTSTRPVMSWGLEDWMADSGTILGGGAGSTDAVDLDVYSEFKSMVYAVNGPPTEDVMTERVAKYLDAYPGLDVDTILTTAGVTTKHLQQFGLTSNQNFFDRQGKALEVKGGWSKVSYEFAGRTLDWYIDPLCLKNRMYIVQLKNGNIKRYTPPRIAPGDQRLEGGAGTDGEIQFYAPVAGHTGIFMGANDANGQPLDILQAPFWQFNLIAPVDPRGIKLTGVLET